MRDNVMLSVLVREKDLDTVGPFTSFDEAWDYRKGHGEYAGYLIQDMTPPAFTASDYQKRLVASGFYDGKGPFEEETIPRIMPEWQPTDKECRS